MTTRQRISLLNEKKRCKLLHINVLVTFFQTRRQLEAKRRGTSFITPGCALRIALHKVSPRTDRRALITVILKVKSLNRPSPEFQIVQVWRDGDRIRKMIRVESGIFWMGALWHRKTDCEWHSTTGVGFLSVSAVSHTQTQPEVGRWGWSLCLLLRGCYSPRWITYSQKIILDIGGCRQRSGSDSSSLCSRGLSGDLMQPLAAMLSLLTRSEDKVWTTILAMKWLPTFWNGQWNQSDDIDTSFWPVCVGNVYKWTVWRRDGESQMMEAKSVE